MQNLASEKETVGPGFYFPVSDPLSSLIHHPSQQAVLSISEKKGS